MHLVASNVLLLCRLGEAPAFRVSSGSNPLQEKIQMNHRMLRLLGSLVRGAALCAVVLAFLLLPFFAHAQTVTPASISETEHSFAGAWTWNGTAYIGSWSNGAKANL